MKVKAQRYLMKKTQHIVLMSLTRWHDLTAEQCTDGICTFPQDFTNFHKIHIWQELIRTGTGVHYPEFIMIQEIETLASTLVWSSRAILVVKEVEEEGFPPLPGQ